MFKTNIIGEDGLDWAPQEMKIPLNFFIHYTALKKKGISPTLITSDTLRSFTNSRLDVNSKGAKKKRDMKLL